MSGSTMAAGPYDGLRALALHTSAKDLGLNLPGNKVSAYGVVMDMGMPNGTATLVAFSTGDASLYLSSGGGIIGGRGHAEVRLATHAWLRSAQAHLASFKPATGFDGPADGQVRFFVLTNQGVLSATAQIAETDAGKVTLSPVWVAGQQLLTDLRLSMNKPTN